MYRNLISTAGKEILRTYSYDKEGKTEKKYRNGKLVEVNLYGIDGILKRGIYSDGKIIDFTVLNGTVAPLKIAINKAKNIDIEQVLSTIEKNGTTFLPPDYAPIKTALQVANHRQTSQNE